MGCDFCASTRQGWRRNLTAGEIVEQFLILRARAPLMGRRLHTVVFMGVGEPLLIWIMSSRPLAGSASATGRHRWRQITVSTVGIVSGIDRLAREDFERHAGAVAARADDRTRRKIVPSNAGGSVAEIVSAAKRYYAATGRVTNIAYCLLDGVNDSDDHARALAKLLRVFART